MYVEISPVIIIIMAAVVAQEPKKIILHNNVLILIVREGKQWFQIEICDIIYVLLH